MIRPFALLLACLWATGCPQDIVSSDLDGARGTSPLDATFAQGDAGPSFGPDRDPRAGDDADLTDAALSCHVSRLAPCDDPDEAAGSNDERSTATLINNPAQFGCSNEVFTPGSYELSSLICPRENADWYATLYRPCRSSTFIIEITLRPITPCEPGALRLEVGLWPCDAPGVQCTTTGADQTVAFEVPAGSSIGLTHIGVIRTGTDVRIDYQLTYRERR